MSIAQRSTSVASITSNGYYTVDRFKNSINSFGTWTQSQSTDVPTGQGFATSLKLDCTTADASPSASGTLSIEQLIEGQNLQYLKKGTANAVSLTTSFWVKSNKTGTYIAELYDGDNTRQISAAYTVNVSDTWEKKTITFEGDTTGALDNDNAQSLNLQFWLGAGTTYTSGTLNTTWGASVNANRGVGQVNIADSTSNDWYITGVQLEAGTTASDFEFLPVDVNLARCQRYFWQIQGVSGSNITLGMGFSNLSTNNTQGDIITSTDTPGVLGVSNTIASNNTVETRIGNEPFSSPDSNNRVTTVQNTPVNTPNNTPMQVTGNKAPAINKKIDLQKITDKSLNDFITSNASLKGIQDSLSTISLLSPTQLSKMLSGPGSENLNEEELIAKLKANIFSELNPNPDKVNEVRSKVDTFTDALRNVIRAEWEAATRYVDEEYKVPFEIYYNEVEDDKIKDFIQQLNGSQLYTEEEISLGITRTEIQDKYQIIIDGSKVSVRPRSGK